MQALPLTPLAMSANLAQHVWPACGCLKTQTLSGRRPAGRQNGSARNFGPFPYVCLQMGPYTTIFMTMLADLVVNYPHLYPEANGSAVPAPDLNALNTRAAIPTGYPSWMHTAR